MKELFQLMGVILVWLIGLGLLVATALWAFSNIWLLLGIFAAIIVLLIIYGMMTSDNDGISGVTRLSVAAIVGYLLYAMFA